MDVLVLLPPTGRRIDTMTQIMLPVLVCSNIRPLELCLSTTGAPTYWLEHGLSKRGMLSVVYNSINGFVDHFIMDSAHDESNSSFLSDVLDFVSRELNQFVANATGAPVATEPDTQRRRETRSKRPSELQRVKSISSHTSTSDSLPVHPERCYSAVAKHLALNSASRRKHPMTMPGALLPRSPTSEPHEVPGLEEGVCQPANIVDVGQGAGEPGEPEAAQSSSSQSVDRTQRAEVDVQPRKNISLAGACTSLGACKQQNAGVDMPETIAQRNERDYAIWVPPESSSCHDREPVGRRVGRSVMRSDEERMQDKEKIRILEEEVKRLRDQLSLKRDNMSSLIPPPPPPPPPPLPPARIKSTCDRVPLDPSEASSLIASARASLKRAPAPVEASINPSRSTKRQGLPTVGIPPDKMAAFLNEMKSVRLRKIANRPVSGVDSSADSSTSWSNTSLSSGNSSILSHSLYSKPSSSSVHSHASNIPAVGAKRKREWFDDGKRRPMPVLEPVAVVDRARTNAELWIATDPKTSSERSNGASSRSWPSFSIADTTTPSLTSDNDQDINPDDLPATPPQTHANFSRGIRESLEVIDVDDFVKQTSTSGDVTQDLVTETLSAPAGKSNFFSKRTPLSPLPSDTPRKPHPPSRLRRPPRQKNVIDNDFLSLSDISTGSRVRSLYQESYSNQPQGQDQRLSGISRRSGIHHRRQDRDRWSSTLDAEPEPSSNRTLDEELRHAVNSLKSVGEDISFDTEECDVFLETGTRDKSSFSSFPVVERSTENRRTHPNQRLPAR